MLIPVGVIFKGLFIAINRAGSWLGSGYLLKKGIKKKKISYFAAAIIFSVVMFLGLWVILKFFH